jgi:hypothetical protein
MNSRVPLKSAYSEVYRPGVPWVARPSLGWSETGPSLTLAALLSLGPWAAIWKAIAALGSAVLW